MCSLFGLIDYHGILNQKQKTRIISVLAEECEERGRDAAGISYVHRGRLCIYKRPLPAHRLRFRVPKGSRVVMGHTRLTTQGSEKRNYNNHPFAGRVTGSAFALAHNGVLYNDKELQRSEQLPKTNIQTDSYAIVQLIEKQGTLDFNSLQQAAEKIRGSFTFTVLDQGNSLYIVKGDNPICIYHFDGFYLYASTEEILQRTLGKLKWLPQAHEQIELFCGDMLRINTNGQTELDHFNFTHMNSWNDQFWPAAYHRTYNSPRSEYEKELMEYAQCCGICPEEIRTLLDSGYDFEDIEELLCGCW